MDLSNKVLTIEGKEYLVISNIEHNGKEYVYLSNKDDDSDTKYREVVKEDGEMFLQEIDNELFKNKIFELFAKDFQE